MTADIRPIRRGDLLSKFSVVGQRHGLPYPTCAKTQTSQFERQCRGRAQVVGAWNHAVREVDLANLVINGHTCRA